MTPRPLFRALALTALTAACGGPLADEDGSQAALARPTATIAPAPVCPVAAPGSAVTIDARRSLMITDRAILDATDANGARRFRLRRVFEQFSAQNGNPALTATTLFRQLWDTQNAAPGLGRGAHCDDDDGTVNGFPYSCRAEGQQAGANADAILDGYFPIALVNRFDLAPTDGANCGEYRVIYSKGGQLSGRNFVIFESVLPNPTPACGLEACRPIQNLWASFSTSPRSAADRAADLDQLYFSGVSGFAPVLHIDHFALAGRTNGYGRGATGQIRTNQFVSRPWDLKELQLSRSCPRTTDTTIRRIGTGCDLLFTPVSVKGNPFGTLFDPTNPLNASFQAEFIDNVESLARPDLGAIGFARAPNEYNAGESPDAVTSNYRAQFGTAPSAFRTAIQDRLTQLGSTLTPNDIIARAHTQSCIGCHQQAAGAALGGGLTWPSSLGFVHVSEFTETGPEGPRFQISAALTNVFLPGRKAVMESFLNRGALDVVARAPRTSSAEATTLTGRISN